MALPVVTSVTQATAPQASGTKQPDTATWSDALAAANVAPQPQQTSTSTNAVADKTKADTKAADAVSDASDQNNEAADTTASPTQKKPAKHDAAAMPLADTAQTDSTGNSQQAVSPFAAMLLNNSTTSGQTAQPVAKPPVEQSKVEVKPAVAEQPAVTAPASTLPDVATGNANGASVPDVKIDAKTAANTAQISAASQPATATQAAVTAQVASVVSQPAQIQAVNTTSAADATQGAQEPSAATASVTPAAKTAPTSTAASLLARSAAQQAVAEESGTNSKTMPLPQHMDASSISAVAQVSAAAPANATAPTAPTTGTVAATTVTADSGSVTASSASALAATVTAMHQAGQSGAVLRLDPPGLGNLSVHVGLGQQGQVNVLFVPDTSAGAQALQSGLNGLSQSMAQSGLTLGQAQVGGQFGQSAGQSGQHAQNWRGGGTSTPQRNTSETSSPDNSGVSAYA